MFQKVDAMEKLVEELSFQVPFKERTEIGDTVIMLRENEDGQISGHFARILGFDRDATKKDEWWHVHFVFQELPPQPRTIILQTSHFTGQEIFTMGGRKVFIKAVNFEAYADESAALSQPLSEPLAPTGDNQSGINAPKAPNKPKPNRAFTLIK